MMRLVFSDRPIKSRRDRDLSEVDASLQKRFYKKNKLIHIYNEYTGKYEINFNVKGFDRDPLTSLIVECKKSKTPIKSSEFTLSKSNYNRYGYSLLFDPEVRLTVPPILLALGP